MASRIITYVWLRQEEGYHQNIVGNAQLHVQLAVTHDPDQCATATVVGQLQDQPLSLISVGINKTKLKIRKKNGKFYEEDFN